MRSGPRRDEHQGQQHYSRSTLEPIARVIGVSPIQPAIIARHERLEP